MNQRLRMPFRPKALLCATTCLAAMLTAATFAQAVDQTSKNGCTSPEAYGGALTSPEFDSNSDSGGFIPRIDFQGWFEVEGVNPANHDMTVVEYGINQGFNEPRNWIEFGRLSSPNASPGGSPEQPFSNNGLGAPPTFQPYTFPLPVAARDQPDLQVRIRFATGDEAFQGFRGTAVDAIALVLNTTTLTENFESMDSTWASDAASGAGAPFWQVLDESQNVTVKNPEINPQLVTLPDSGALPATANGARFAWFGNVASGTFCGPDFANGVPETTITGAPPASSASSDASLSFDSSVPFSSFECRLDGADFTACASPQTYSGLTRSMHNFEVRATSPTGFVDPTPASHTWSIRAATLDDLSDPQQGVSVNIEEVAGRVFVGVPAGAASSSGTRGSGRASQKGINFVPISEARQIPVGSFLDTRKGTVRLQSARDRKGTRQTGTFLNSLFQVRQSRKRRTRGLTDLVLKGASFRRCRTVGRGKGATASVDRRTIRRLRANANGRFRTRGRNSSATVRGTIWDTTDRCDGTLTKVRRGRVVVRDFRRKRNIVLRAGKSYLARAPG